METSFSYSDASHHLLWQPTLLCAPLTLGTPAARNVFVDHINCVLSASTPVLYSSLHLAFLHQARFHAPCWPLVCALESSDHTPGAWRLSFPVLATSDIQLVGKLRMSEVASTSTQPSLVVQMEIPHRAGVPCFAPPSPRHHDLCRCGSADRVATTRTIVPCIIHVACLRCVHAIAVCSGCYLLRCVVIACG